MGHDMETITFSTTVQFQRWAQRIVDDANPHYDRVPVPPQIWIFGDGHIEELAHGKRGGTMLSNLRFMVKTATGELKHENDFRIVNDIDKRNGVMIMVNWADKGA